MQNQSTYGKPPRPNKISSKNVSTVNLGLQYNALVNEREPHVGAAKNDGSIYPTTYSLSTVLGGNTHNLAKIANQRRKDRPLSSKGYNSQQATQSATYFINPYVSSTLGTKHKHNTSNASNALGCYSTSQALSKSISPVDTTNENEKKKNHEAGRLPKKQVYLPGDCVVFAESSSAPGVPIIYRLDEERQTNPDKLNLDRRKLNVCPMLEGEENLRLLNFQHNSIQKIQHLSMLKKLIFLDLYDNQIEEISGLSSLRALRVLMLGKNKIKKISNLQDLAMLDVLDLHGNKIQAIEGISHLSQLRVLNLAGNDLNVVKHLAGLDSLSELNLRRNFIQNVFDIDQLPNLQRLFLSFNEIKSFDDMSCVRKSTSLIEISLDGNPFANDSNYKQLVLQNITSLKQLDIRRLSEEEKRIACVMARKEEERQKEQNRISKIKEKRRLAINNAQRHWEKQIKETRDLASPSSIIDESHSDEMMLRKSTPLSTSRSSTAILTERSSKRMHSEIKDFSTCHLAELENDSLNLYGPGSLNALDKSWGEKTSNSVVIIVFKYIEFDQIVPYLSTLHSRFPCLTTLQLEATKITSLNDINAFALMDKLDNLNIFEEGNSVTKISLWKPYLIYRLSHLKLKLLNGNEITDSDILYAEKLFSSIAHITTSSLTQTRLLLLLSNSQSKMVLESETVLSKSKKPDKNRNLSSESVCKAGLSYNGKSDKEIEEAIDRKSFSLNFVREILHTAKMTDRKEKVLDNILPQLLSDMIGKYYKDITDIDAYCDNSLEKIKKSINMVG